MREKFVKNSGIIWPLFYTGVFYLLFTGILTLLFGWIGEEAGLLSRHKEEPICLFWRYRHLYKSFG